MRVPPTRTLAMPSFLSGSSVQAFRVSPLLLTEHCCSLCHLYCAQPKHGLPSSSGILSSVLSSGPHRLPLQPFQVVECHYVGVILLPLGLSGADGECRDKHLRALLKAFKKTSAVTDTTSPCMSGSGLWELSDGYKYPSSVRGSSLLMDSAHSSVIECTHTLMWCHVLRCMPY